MHKTTRTIALIALLALIPVVLWIGLTPTPATHAQGTPLFFTSTGHSLDNQYGFLSYWQTHNGEQVLGAPVTEAIEENGLMVQYFEYGRLELHTDLEGAPVLPGRVGADYASDLWISFSPPSPHSYGEGASVFDATGYALRDPFLSFWEAYGGLDTFGYPISDPIWEYVGDEMLLLQYFERARLESHPAAGDALAEVRISSLGRDLALLRGYHIAPLDPSQVPGARIVDEQQTNRFQSVPPPTPTAAPVANQPAPTATPVPPLPTAQPDAPVFQSGKHIIVNLSRQWLYAYNGDTLMFDAPVSTGRDGFNTPTGTYSVYAKVRSQTMSGNIGGESYRVPNVPHVMYINGGVALHGTYWHNNFGTGTRMSHGCINLPLSSAAWLYDWAPLGTPVRVQY